MKRLFFIKPNEAILFSVWLIILPLIPFFSIGIFREDIGLFPTIALSCLLFAIALYRKRKNCVNMVAHVSVVDIWVTVFIYFFIVRLYAASTGEKVDEIIVFKIIMLYVVYAYVRQLSTASTLFKGIIIGASLQAVIIILQKYGFIESRHYLFAVTGTFANPAQVAGFMALGVIITISTFLNELTKSKLKIAIVYGGFVILQIVALCYTDSRASFVAILAGLFFIEYKKIKKLWVRRHRFLIPILLFVIISSSIGVFQYRPDSVKARMLIWRVSCDMIADQPIWGHGIGIFDKKYMLYQADYFTKYPESHFAFVADNVIYPYNELLRIAVELGLIGVILILFLFFVLLRHYPNSEQDIVVKGALVAWLVFAMFSYPGNVLPLLLLFAMLIGLADSRLCFSFRFLQWEVKVLQFIGIIGCIICLKSMCFYAIISRQTQEIKLGRSDFLLNREIVERLLPNTTFAQFYTHYINRKDEIISDSLIHNVPPTCELYCYLGDMYVKRKSYDKAEYYYGKANCMIPARLTPNYQLWNLYLLNGDTTQAIQKAKYIQKQKLKVENSFTIKAKTEIRKFLSENGIDSF